MTGVKYEQCKDCGVYYKALRNRKSKKIVCTKKKLLGGANTPFF